MRAKHVDVVDVATDDVHGWFEACETEAECAEPAKDMKDVIDAIAATNAERLSCPECWCRARFSRVAAGCPKNRESPRTPSSGACHAAFPSGTGLSATTARFLEYQLHQATDADWGN